MKYQNPMLMLITKFRYACMYFCLMVAIIGCSNRKYKLPSGVNSAEINVEQYLRLNRGREFDEIHLQVKKSIIREYESGADKNKERYRLPDIASVSKGEGGSVRIVATDGIWKLNGERSVKELELAPGEYAVSYRMDIIPPEGWRYSFLRKEGEIYIFCVERLTHRPRPGEGIYGNYVEVDKGIFRVSKYQIPDQ